LREPVPALRAGSSISGSAARPTERRPSRGTTARLRARRVSCAGNEEDLASEATATER